MASRVISAVLKFKDQNFSSGMRQANRDAGDFGRIMQQAQNKAENFGQRANDVFKGVGVAAGALVSGAVAGLGVAIGQSILEMDDAFAQLEARTGATGADLANLEQAAIDVFKRGYGESLTEVSEGLARVSQNMHDIDPSQIADVTAQAMLLAKTTDSDINEVTRGAQNLMDAFGISADTAFDLFTKGAQSGLNMSNDMFDQMGEFSSVAEQAGYSAEELFGVMQRGAENGVYNLDRVNNAILEFGLKTTDGNKATGDSFSKLSDSTQQMWRDMQAGKVTAKDLSSTVIQELKAMDDQNLANQIGISMWGTTWEDNTQDVMYAMFETTDALKDFEGATDAAANAVEGSFGNRVKSAFRDLTTSIASLADTESGKQALDSIASTAESLVPKLTSLASTALNFAGVIAENWKPIATVVASATAAIVAFKVGMAGMTIISTVAGFLKTLTTVTNLQTAAWWAFNVAASANPIGLVIAAIAGLIAIGVALYMNWDTVKAKAGELWTKVKEVFGKVYDWGAEKIGGVTDFFGGLVDKVGDFISRITNFKLPDWVTSIGSTISGAASKVSNWVEGNFAVGSNRIPNDMVAQIHKDEMIIPARQAQKVRAMGGNIDNIDKIVAGRTQPQQVAVPVQNKQATGNTFGDIIINAKGVTSNEVINEVVPKLKLALANM